MSIKLSHSSKNKWLQCGESYRLHYLEKWRPITLSSALVMGSSIDEALNHMLLNKDKETVLQETIDIFNRTFEQGQDSARNIVDMPLNPNLRYFKNDYDHDLLDKPEWRELLKYDGKFFDTKNDIDAKLKEGADWLDIPEESRMVYNYANWLCLQKKGHLLLNAYHKDILPNIKRVLVVQHKVELLDEDGNNLNGVIDAIVELHDGRICIMDNKTSSQEYEQDSVRGSEQLATYQQIMNIFAEDSENSWNDKITACVYAVMVKKLDKDITKTCKKCGTVNTSSHKLCDVLQDVPGEKKPVRCNGEFDKVKKFNVKTQFIVDTINEEFAASVLENAVTVKSCIEQGLFPKNYSACDNQFGQKCVFYSKCHGGDTKGLIKLEESK